MQATPKPIKNKDGEENEIADYQNYIHRFIYKENVTTETWKSPAEPCGWAGHFRYKCANLMLSPTGR